MIPTRRIHANKLFWRLGIYVVLLAKFAGQAQGAVTDLANAPMINGSSFQVKPNIFLMMDDSGSMAWDYMPDNKNTVFFPAGTYGYVSNQCNGVFYNPLVTYIPPPKPDGTSYPNSTFLAAPVDGFGTTTTATTNLSTSFQIQTYTSGGGGGTAGPAYYYTYSGTNTSGAQKTYFNSTSSFFKECNTSVTAANAATVTVALKPTDAGQVNQILVASTRSATPTYTTYAIMAAPTGVQGNSYLLAQDIANQINACTAAITGNCNVAGFSASVSAIVTPGTNSTGAVVITAPDGTYAGTLTAVSPPFPTTPAAGNTSNINDIEVQYSGVTSSTVAVSVSRNSSGTVSGITVNGLQLMGQTTGPQTSTANLAGAIVDNINDCTSPATMAAAQTAGTWQTTNCPASGTGYTAVLTYSSGTTVNGFIIYAPTATTSTPVIAFTQNSGTASVAPGAFTVGSASTSSSITATAFASAPGVGLFHKVVVSATSGPGGTDERTNYANWYSYYRTRILMMKSATGIAFNNLSSNYRVGFGTMNNNGSNMFVNISDFNSTQKSAFLTKLYSATAANSTPLLRALSYSGLLYANKMPSNTFNGVAVVDPIQYSCQQNYTVLTTDGFWNDQNNLILNTSTGAVIGPSTTAVGNQDGAEPSTSKQNDGATGGWSQQTGTLQFTTDIQQTVAPLKMATNLKSTVAPLKWATNLQRTAAPLLQSNYATTYTSTLYTLTVSSTLNGTYSNAGKNATYTCITSGTSSGSSVYCKLGTVGTVTTGLSSCTSTYSNPGSASTNNSRQVSQCTAVSGWTAPAAVGANGTCTPSGTVQCSTGTATTSYVSSYPPSCAPTFNAAGSNTADASGNVVTACTTAGTYGTPVAVGANGTCNGSLANVQCSVGTGTSSYVGSYPPTCAPNFNATGSNTADGTGSVITACSTGSYSTPANVGANGACNGSLPNVQCSLGTSTTSYVTNNPPSCTPTFNATGPNIANASGNAITCPAPNGTFNTTWTNIPSGGSCTPGTDVQCQYNWGTGANVGNTCSSSFSSGSGTWNINPGTKCTPTALTGGTSNTLADVAEFYYINDLRTAAMGNCTSGSSTGQTLCSSASPDPYNNVPPSGPDKATWQHMTTFTMGLGERGYMNFSPTYQSDTTGDYAAINTLAANPPSVCSWQAAGSGTCTWPIPNASGSPDNIDDLWHAAVDGRGTYYSATDPTTLASGLTNALANVVARTGTAAAATTSNPNITSGDNFLFSSTFVTLQWSGELIRQTLDLKTGQPVTVINSSGQLVPQIDWAAQAQLDAMPWANRNVYTFDTANTNGNNLKLFTWANLTATQQGYFKTPAISTLSQLCNTGSTCLPVWTAGTPYVPGNEYRVGTTWYHVNTAYTSGAAFGATDTANTTVVTGANGSNLVNFLTGDRSNEEGVTNDVTKYFRHRYNVLGDIVDAEAAYVKKSNMSYADPGYTPFSVGNLNRQGMVYVGANDGMMHAFYADTDTMDPATGLISSTGTVSATGGAEAWAYMPSMLLPQLFHLADKNYQNNHQYYVDGTPAQAEICVASCSNASTAVWKTILVGGLNGGGRGYYALDITNPANPVALWEFTDTNMGYTYGNPVITKLADGTWVVLVTSGYNNVNPGDGVGRLYVLNAYTGTPHTAINGTGIISTGVGSTGSPSGLARIAAEVISPSTDSTSLQVYGGDLFGNVWRFDINNNVGAPGYDAQLLATLIGPNGTAQPITAKPEVGIIGSSTVVFVGTGRYLGNSDLNAADEASPNLQTIYGIYDPLTPGTTPSVAIYPNPRLDPKFVQQTLTLTTCPTGASSSLCSVGQNIFTTTNNPVSIPGNDGWYVDLPLSGQLVYTDPALQLGTLAITSNVPNGSTCSVGGTSYLHYLNYKTGGAVNTATFSTTNVFGITTTTYISGESLGNALATRPTFVELPNGTVVALVRMGNGTTNVSNVPIGNNQAPTRRVSWRELMAK